MVDLEAIENVYYNVYYNVYKWGIKMSKMIRKQIYMPEDQDRFLKTKAQELSITEAEVVREALEVYQAYGNHDIIDQSAWLKEREFLLKLSAAQRTGSELAPRTWKREDLHER
jgi:hypothetical protein